MTDGIDATDRAEAAKRAAAVAAAEQVHDGMAVGLGTGSTVAHFLPALAARGLRLRCVATSAATETEAGELGIAVEPFAGALDGLDLAVDGADQVSPDRWLVKGGGGAHTREKIVAAAAARFVVIVSTDKLVDRLDPPVPMELLRFGLPATLRRIGEIGPVRIREAPPTPDGGVLADFLGEVGDPAALSAALSAVPGLVDHGLFPPELVSEVLVGQADGSVRRLERGRA
ncbi:MAG TPA: ribose 5-phosphate isomerase A [Actinomycetota bacterium]|nr:ribose 5-phosphate isomerase A [Actinomycetota bacterium]